MYIVFVNDRQQHTTKVIGKFDIREDAYDFCEKKARDFVCEKEGEKREFIRKGDKTPRGYFAIKPNSSLYKFTVCHRERNGWIQNGKMTKLFTFCVVRDDLVMEDEDDYVEFEWEETQPFVYHMDFQSCLDQIAKINEEPQPAAGADEN